MSAEKFWLILGLKWVILTSYKSKKNLTDFKKSTKNEKNYDQIDFSWSWFQISYTILCAPADVEELIHLKNLTWFWMPNLPVSWYEGCSISL